MGYPDMGRSAQRLSQENRNSTWEKRLRICYEKEREGGNVEGRVCVLQQQRGGRGSILEREGYLENVTELELAGK